MITNGNRNRDLNGALKSMNIGRHMGGMAKKGLLCVDFV